MWYLASAVGYSVCMGNWDPQWHIQVQHLGNRAGSDGGWNWWYVHTQLQGPNAGACYSDKHLLQPYRIVVSRLGHQQEPGPTTGTLAVTGALAVSMQ